MARILKPIDDYILVERIEPKEKVVGGIIIPDSAKPNSQYAVVLCVGEGELVMKPDGSGWMRKPIQFQAGDMVLMHKYAENQIPLEDEDERKLSVIKADSVLCQIHETTEGTGNGEDQTEPGSGSPGSET